MDAINFRKRVLVLEHRAMHRIRSLGVQADLEYGLWAARKHLNEDPNNVPMTSKYVTAMLKNNGTTEFALKGGNAQSGNLTTLLQRNSRRAGTAP